MRDIKVNKMNLSAHSDPMRVLVLGGTGATGRLVVINLLSRGHCVRVVVRSINRLPEQIKNHQNLEAIEASLLNLSDPELEKLVQDCDAIVSCLGHNLTFKGVYGHPRRLVTDAVRRLSRAAQAVERNKPIKFVLMNTTGNHNPELDQPTSGAQRTVIWLLRHLLPPHADNEEAAAHLWDTIGHNHPKIEWVVVRPDGLVDEELVTEYEIYPSPQVSAIFASGQTSRINVGHFMAELVSNTTVWQQWKGGMPVIYNPGQVN